MAPETETWEDRVAATADRLAEYLAAHGRTSGWDLCAELGLEEWDVDMADTWEAAHGRRWGRVRPMHGGVAPWFGPLGGA